VLVLWRGEGYRGAVLFDVGTLPPAALRDHLNRVQREHGVGLAFTGPIGANLSETPGYTAATTCKAAPVAVPLTGRDALSAIANPAIGPGRAGAFIPREVRGTYLAAGQGIVVLGDQPLTRAEPLPTGWRIAAPGVLRITADRPVRIESEGAPLPTIAPEQFLPWLNEATTPGHAVCPSPAGDLHFLRAPAALLITPQDRP
jgi:hypothetical protein